VLEAPFSTVSDCLAVSIGFTFAELLVSAKNGPRNLVSAGGTKAVNGLKAAAIRFGNNNPPEVAAAGAITGEIDSHGITVPLYSVLLN
jgi:hypothetical protein